jgi:hypothetical protein
VTVTQQPKVNVYFLEFSAQLVGTNRTANAHGEGEGCRYPEAGLEHSQQSQPSVFHPETIFSPWFLPLPQIHLASGVFISHGVRIPACGTNAKKRVRSTRCAATLCLSLSRDPRPFYTAVAILLASAFVKRSGVWRLGQLLTAAAWTAVPYALSASDRSPCSRLSALQRGCT